MKVYKITEMFFMLPDEFKGEPHDATIEFAKYTLKKCNSQNNKSYDESLFNKSWEQMVNRESKSRVVISHGLARYENDEWVEKREFE